MTESLVVQSFMLAAQVAAQERGPDRHRQRVHERLEPQAYSLASLQNIFDELRDDTQRNREIDLREQRAHLLLISVWECSQTPPESAVLADHVMGYRRPDRHQPFDLGLAQRPLELAEIGEPWSGTVPVAALQEPVCSGERKRQAGANHLLGQDFLDGRV